jgi:ribosomal protein S18 acetylase RimI-like enzyme
LAVEQSEEDQAVSVVTMGFSDDPIVRWVLRDAARFLAYFPRIVKAFGGASFERRTALRTDGFEGAALWLPPGAASDDEAMGALMEEAVPDEEKADVFAFVEQMAGYHPAEPLWYLPLIGVDPMKRGLGHGSALLRQALDACDRDRTAAYLEATSPRNKGLYERHGFDVVGVIQHGSSPPMWPMLRRPRP